MRAAASAVSMAPSSTVATIPNTVTSCYVVTFLTTPVTFSLDETRDLLVDGLLGLANGMLAKGRGGSVEVVLDATIDVCMGIGIGKAGGTAVKGLSLGLEGLTECSEAASLV